MCNTDDARPPEPAARRGVVQAQLRSRTFLVNVSGVGVVTATDYTRQARPGLGVSLVKLQNGSWSIA